MKKIINGLMILAVLFATVLVTSCGVVDKTYNKWYKYENTISSLPIANAGEYEDPNDHQTKQGDGMLKDAQLYVMFNETDGLTICVVSETKQTVTFANGAYTVPNITVAVGAKKTYSTAEFGVLKWNALIRLGSFDEATPPEYNDISSALQGQLNLKRIIAEFLLNNLLA